MPALARRIVAKNPHRVIHIAGNQIHRPAIPQIRKRQSPMHFAPGTKISRLVAGMNKPSLAITHEE